MKGIIETEPVGLDEIEGVYFDKARHGTSYPLNINGFTYCGKPNREFRYHGDIRTANSDVSDLCLICQDGHYKRARGNT